MQQSDSGEVTSETSVIGENPMSEASVPAGAVSAAAATTSGGSNADDELVLDVSGRSLELDLFQQVDDSMKGLYVYKNDFSLVPRSIRRLHRLRTFKFFGNEVNLFPAEFGDLVGLECLQVKLSSPGLNGLSLGKLRGLKELELSKVPPRPSVLTILSEISGLKCLTKLSVCHFSIRYLPPEIGCLSKLEYLDLSFNKLKSLPSEISNLSALISLNVANNKLVELPIGLSLLQRLETLDLSNNRLTSVGSLELGLMQNLLYLNLQYNKLLSCCQIPSWICCNLEGNGKDLSNDDFISSSVEMDVYETSIPKDENSIASNSTRHASSSTLNGHSSNGRCFVSRRSSKRWKRRHYLQQKARQERLNSSRKWKGEGSLELSIPTEADNSQLYITSDIHEDNSLEIIGNDDDKEGDGVVLSVDGEGGDSLLSPGFDKISSKKVCIENCTSNCESSSRDEEDESCVLDEGAKDEDSSLEYKISSKAKRHSDGDLDNPKPCKCHRPAGDSLSLSRKYNDLSFCSVEETMADGFYDAGRDRPFMPLSNYEEIWSLDTREVILLDRKKDEILDATVLSAQALVSRLKLNFSSQDRINSAVDDLHIASLLALFVSDHFGGSDKSTTVARTRKAVSGSNYKKPFVCTCSTGNQDSGSSSRNSRQSSDSAGEINLTDICERSLSSIKARRNSVVVPLGNLQFGVCRHRALLMKYLCDRMNPPIPCELVRGYLDFTPHAWNHVLLKRGGSLVRMVVDACSPYDIREETDPEYFCRYIPLSRTNVSLSSESFPGPGCSFPSLSTSDELEKTAASTLMPCKLGSVEAVAKVRTLEVCGNSMNEIRNFEHSCLGEVRMLGALQHPCIIKIYGHQISSKWILSKEGRPERRILRSSIFMEYVKGGSLKNYLEKVSEAGDKHVPVDIALCIAENVACALSELHSKHIIHRDIKSENILMDFEGERVDDGIMPVVKLCDFDRAVPLRSSSHTCCIAHRGIVPPSVCVGTPRWMAPEVLRAMHEQITYGLEVDIWSYGCLLLELLTLRVPYSDVPELQIHGLLQSGERPPLPAELERLGLMNVPVEKEKSESEMEESGELETLRFLVNLFRRCTEGNPADRPTAMDIYESLVAHTNRRDSRKLSSSV